LRKPAPQRDGGGVVGSVVSYAQAPPALEQHLGDQCDRQPLEYVGRRKLRKIPGQRDRELDGGGDG